MTATTDQQAALEALAAALDPGDFVTTLTAFHDRAACLAVTSRHAAIGEDIYVADDWFWWSWAERIAPISDVTSVAGKVATVLGAQPESAGG